MMYSTTLDNVPYCAASLMMCLTARSVLVLSELCNVSGLAVQYVAVPKRDGQDRLHAPAAHASPQP